jgi:hypothetical protein
MEEYPHIHTHAHQSYSSGKRAHSDWPHHHSHPHIHSSDLDENTHSHFRTFGARHNWAPYVPALGERLKGIRLSNRAGRPKSRRA